MGSILVIHSSFSSFLSLHAPFKALLIVDVHLHRPFALAREY